MQSCTTWHVKMANKCKRKQALQQTPATIGDSAQLAHLKYLTPGTMASVVARASCTLSTEHADSTCSMRRWWWLPQPGPQEPHATPTAVHACCFRLRPESIQSALTRMLPVSRKRWVEWVRREGGGEPHPSDTIASMGRSGHSRRACAA